MSLLLPTNSTWSTASHRHVGPQRAKAVRITAELAASASAAGSRKPSRPRKEVAVRLEATSFSSRKLQATVDIQAPLTVVWEALTDYDNLGTFIPSLVENKCLERRQRGCLLYQVGAQDVALGLKFSAACTLEIKEYPEGIPSNLCTSRGDYGRFFPSPPSSSSGSSSTSGSTSSSTATASSSSSSSAATSSISSYSSMDSMSSMDEACSSSGGVRDISFNLVAGDFQAFKGIWRMLPGAPDPYGSTTLQYSLFVRPHPWLPVKLIEDRISTEVVNNLNAVRRYTERVHGQRAQQQQQAAAAAGPEGSGSSGMPRSSSSSSSTTVMVDSISSEE